MELNSNVHPARISVNQDCQFNVLTTKNVLLEGPSFAILLANARFYKEEIHFVHKIASVGKLSDV